MKKTVFDWPVVQLNIWLFHVDVNVLLQSISLSSTNYLTPWRHQIHQLEDSFWIVWHWKSIMCEVIGCLAAGRYGHEEVCWLHIAHCNQRAYLLTQFRRQGLPQTQLESVFHATILARLKHVAVQTVFFVTTTIYQTLLLLHLSHPKKRIEVAKTRALSYPVVVVKDVHECLIVVR